MSSESQCNWPDDENEKTEVAGAEGLVHVVVRLVLFIYEILVDLLAIH